MTLDSRERFRKYTDEETFNKIVPFGSVSDMWAHCLEAYPDDIAISDGEETFTFSRLEEDAADLRALLAERCPGCRRVGLLIPNSYDFVRAFLGAVTLGVEAVILPVHLPAEAVMGCAMKYRLDALIVHPSLMDKAPAQIPCLPSDLRSGKSLPLQPVSPDTPCVTMFTGGTTGKSKAAQLSHDAVLQGTVNGCYGIKDVFGQRYLLVLPLSHVFGLIRNLMTSLYTGSALRICRDPKEMFREAAAFRPTILVMVPALAEMALTLSRQFGRNMLGPDLKTIICGAAAVAPYLLEEYPKLGITLLPGYGLTESANLVSGNPETVTKPTSVGIPYPNQELRIENGELWLKGRNMMTGYLAEPEDVSFQDGWFRTGDLVRMDEDGFLYITGRIKEVIVLPTGENISPAELEARFDALPFVMASQVFEDYGEGGKRILALEIVPRAAEAAKLGEDPGAAMMEALQEVNRSLPSFQRISRIQIRDSDFARTPSMKIVRYQKCK